MLGATLTSAVPAPVPASVGNRLEAELNGKTSVMEFKLEWQRMRVLHLISRSHITASYFQFLREVPAGDIIHTALVPPGDPAWEAGSKFLIVRPANRLSYLWHYIRLATISQKVFVHSLSGGWATIALVLAPWALKKVYWLMWGADLYSYRQRNSSLKRKVMEALRRFVIRRIGHLVTYLARDVELARSWYGAKGRAHECLLYPGNTTPAIDPITPRTGPLRVQVGNSADPENRHEEVFRAIAPIDDSIMVVSPMVYGDDEYRSRVLALGEELFGDRFVPQLTLVPLDEYREQLRNIDVAIFNHSRQQAMGNTISLLGMGRRVILRKSTSQWDLLQSAGIRVFAIEDGIPLRRLEPELASNNAYLVSRKFSLNILTEQWHGLLNS